ncbi:unnamed protein product [Dicrocoelium dendriticum]|nr:unnamed protein product [Dicrocoelium dendriticum]
MDYENCPRKHEVDTYIREHKLVELFNNLTSLLIYNQPDNPRKFMLETLCRLRESRGLQCEPPSLFTQKNAEAIFDMLDPCEKRAISYKQYCHALETLGITKYDTKSTGSKNDEISKEDYLEEA